MRKRKPTLLGTTGAALGGAGIAGLVWGNLHDFDPNRIGVVLLILGAMLICTKALNRNNLASNEIFNLGRERGEADSYDDGYRDGLEDGKRQRPVVVPLPPQCTCGNPDCLKPVGTMQSVGSVADRG